MQKTGQTSRWFKEALLSSGTVVFVTVFSSQKKKKNKPLVQPVEALHCGKNRTSHAEEKSKVGLATWAVASLCQS
jgi:hypothetical protein